MEKYESWRFIFITIIILILLRFSDFEKFAERVLPYLGCGLVGLWEKRRVVEVQVFDINVLR